ncbi:MAG: ACP S-malonyltransferase [bacterium]|nr:ACP S-malonyltransferase [bacterium]
MSKIAFIFPGQGSQSVGMGKDLVLNFKLAAQIFEEASDAIGIDLKKLSFEGPEDELNMTASTQPAILTTSVAALEVLKAETDIKADFLAGHSLGEYTALVHGGAFAFADAVRIVRRRGEFMQAAVPGGAGAMAAILGMEKNEVADVCSDAESFGLVSAANFNSPGQIVVSGEKKAVERAVEIAKERGAKRAVMLPVSVPSHCALMLPAGDLLKEELAKYKIADLGVPVVSNVEASTYLSAGEVSDLLVRQLSSPVRWDESVICLKDAGADTVIEVGPGRVLSGLVKRIDSTFSIKNIEDLSSLEKLKSATV